MSTQIDDLYGFQIRISVWFHIKKKWSKSGLKLLENKLLNIILKILTIKHRVHSRKFLNREKKEIFEDILDF